MKDGQSLDLTDHDDNASCNDWDNCADNRDQESGVWLFAHFDARIDM